MLKKYAAILATVLLLASGVVFAKAYEEGTHYVRIEPQPAATQGDRVEVAEFFMFTCPHCRDFEPYIESWIKNKPANVDFVRIPALFGGPANMHAKVYYALEAMGEAERLTAPLFQAIHERKLRLQTLDEMDVFLAEQGVDLEKLHAAMQSFSVAAKLNRASSLVRRYGIRGVPSLVVDGRYRSGTGFESYKEMTEVIDVMVDRVLQQHATAK